MRAQAAIERLAAGCQDRSRTRREIPGVSMGGRDVGAPNLPASRRRRRCAVAAPELAPRRLRPSIPRISWLFRNLFKASRGRVGLCRYPRFGTFEARPQQSRKRSACYEPSESLDVTSRARIGIDRGAERSGYRSNQPERRHALAPRLGRGGSSDPRSHSYFRPSRVRESAYQPLRQRGFRKSGAAGEFPVANSVRTDGPANAGYAKN